MCNKEEFEKTIDKSLVEELNHPEKFQFTIELQKFQNMCYEINTILSKRNYFLRVFELKNKFRQFMMKEKSKQKIVRQLSSCLIEKYSGFTVISIEFKKKTKLFQKHIHLYIEKEKKGMLVRVIIAINFLFWKRGEKDIWKIVQEGQELFIILITNT